MKKRSISVCEFDRCRSQIIDDVSQGKAHITITRFGKKEAVMISHQDYRLLSKALEEDDDLEAAKAAWRPTRPIAGKTLKEIAQELKTE